MLNVSELYGDSEKWQKKEKVTLRMNVTVTVKSVRSHDAEI